MNILTEYHKNGNLGMYLIINFVIVVLLGLGVAQGLILPLFLNDVTYITSIITFATGVTIFISIVKAFQLTKLSLNSSKMAKRLWHDWATHTAGQVASEKEAIGNRLMQSIEIIRFSGRMMVTLGLIGTVIGMIIMFAGMGTVDFTSIETVKTLIPTMLSGLSVALSTTLVGAVANIWLTMNHYILKQNCVGIYTKITT